MTVIVAELGSPTKSGKSVEIVTRNTSSVSMKLSPIIRTSKHPVSPDLALLGSVIELLNRAKSSFPMVVNQMSQAISQYSYYTNTC